MVWAILALLGVPLWLCAAGIGIMVWRNRSLRKRHGDIPARVRWPLKTRWTRGHGLWVSDVFAWRASPAAWNDKLMQVAGVTLRSPTDEEQHKLRRLGEGVQIATLSGPNGDLLEVATGPEKSTALAGPFAADAISGSPPRAPQPLAVASTSTERS